MSTHAERVQQQLEAYRKDLERYPTGHREVLIYKNLHIVIERMSAPALGKKFDNWRGAVLYEDEWINPKENEPFKTRDEKWEAMYETLNATVVRIEPDFLSLKMGPFDDGRASLTARCIGVDTLKLDDVEINLWPELQVKLCCSDSTYKNFEWMKQYMMRIADVMDQFFDSNLIH